jgi:hypothetical protein
MVLRLIIKRTMEKYFLPYDLCILAQKKGFDDDCLAFHENNKFLKEKKLIVVSYNQFAPENETKFVTKTKNSTVPQWAVAAPLYDQIIDWLDETHKLVILVKKNILSDNDYANHFIFELYDESGMIYFGNDSNKYKCLNKSIRQALNLIK